MQLVPPKCYSVATTVCDITTQKETIFIPFNSGTVNSAHILNMSTIHPIFQNDMTNHTFARNTQNTYNYQNGILYKSVVLHSSSTYYNRIYIEQQPKKSEHFIHIAYFQSIKKRRPMRSCCDPVQLLTLQFRQNFVGTYGRPTQHQTCIFSTARYTKFRAT